MFQKILLFVPLLFTACAVSAQASVTPRIFRIAVISPIFLDSAFDGAAYKYGKNFPRFTQQGLDFVQGAEIALDSMGVGSANVQVRIFDSKSDDGDISTLLLSHKLDSTDLLIGAVKDSDFIRLAGFAGQKNIPFISATYPNDGGITANPFLVIVNPTLRAHCESIFSYLLQKHSADNIFLVRKKGPQEDKIAGYFKAINGEEGKPLLNLQVLGTDEDMTLLKNRLDSNRHNIIIGGSLNEDFAVNLATAAYSLRKKYNTELIGMPNWDGFQDLRRSALKDFPILYTTAYYNLRTDSNSRIVQNAYLKKYKGNPSEMSYKGYECMLYFSNLITRYPDDFVSHLNDFGSPLFSGFLFKPVYLNKKETVPDYFENKHLFFMKIENGRLQRVM